MTDWTIWAPVAAGLGGSALTAFAALGVVAVQRWLGNRDAADQERAAAYDDFAARAVAFTLRAQWVGEAVRLRSGLREGLAVTLHGQPLLEPLAFYDWFSKDQQPLLTAWSKVTAVGSQEAINAANDVLSGCMEIMEAARTPAGRRGIIRSLRGEVWTARQREQVQSALATAFDALETFTQIVRQQTGREAVVLPRAAQRSLRDGELTTPPELPPA